MLYDQAAGCKLAFKLYAWAHRRHKNVPDHLQAVPLGYSARQGDLEQEVALQDLPHAIEGHLELPVAQQPGLDLGQGLLVLLRQRRKKKQPGVTKKQRLPSGRSIGCTRSPPRFSSAHLSSSSHSPVWIPGYIFSPAGEKKVRNDLAEELMEVRITETECEHGAQARCLVYYLLL